MRIDLAFLCEYAEHTDNKQAINARGIGIQRAAKVPHTPVEWVVYLVAVIRTEASEVGPHELTLSISDSRGNLPSPPPWTVKSEPSPQERHSYISIVADLGLQIHRPGRHSIRIKIDGREFHRLDFRIEEQ